MTIIVKFIYKMSTILNCRCVKCNTQTLIHKVFTSVGGSEGEIYMNEIVIKHNGIEYTKEDIIKILDLVLEITGERV